MDARVEATSQPQGIVLAIKANFDDTDVSSDVHNEKIREEKVNLTLVYCKFGICVKDLALCHLPCWHSIVLWRHCVL